MLLLNNIYSDYQSTVVTKLTGDKWKQLSSDHSSIFSERKCVYVYVHVYVSMHIYMFIEKNKENSIY